MKLTLEQVKSNLILDEELNELHFEYKDAEGNEVAIDIDNYDKTLIFVYCADKVLYTFSKQYTNLNHAINGINKFFNS